MSEFDHYVPNTHMTLRRNVGRDNFMFDTQQDNVKHKQIYSEIRREWNALPLKIRECHLIGQFKKKLKTELFSQL